MLVKFLKAIGIFLVKLGLLVGGFYLLIAVFFGLLWLIGSNMEEKKVSGVKEQVEIILDENEESYVNRVGKLLYTKHDKNYKLTDHKIKFDRKDGSILVRVADSSLEFNYPYSLMVTTDWRDKVKKVNSFYMTLALTPQGRIKNSKARSRIYELIKGFTDAGWKRYLSLSSARILGEEVYSYNEKSKLYTPVSLDDKHVLNDEEWMSLASYSWEFYFKDKARLTLRVDREQKGRKIDLDEGYFITIDFDTVGSAKSIDLTSEYEKKTYLEKQGHWKSLRIKEEKKAIEKGYHIDYSYEDSPLNRGIFDLSKHNDEVDENVTCTKTGYWQSYITDPEKVPQLSKKEGKIFFYEAGMVFLEKDEALSKHHNLLRWRFLGTKDEYDLKDGKLIKKVENEKGEKVSMFSEGDVCPKNGYWEAFFYKEKGSKGIAYFNKGEALSTNSKEPLAILLKWKYLGDENDFDVVSGRLVRRG